MDPGWFRAGTRKERPCFAAECGPDPFWAHTSTRGSIFRSLRLRTQFRAATRKERPCFAAECGFGPPWAHRDPGSFRAGTRKERPCFAAECGPDPFGHTRALQGPFFDPKTQNPKPRSPEGFRAATRKDRRKPRDWHLAQAKMLLQNQPYFFQVYGGRSRV